MIQLFDRALDKAAAQDFVAPVKDASLSGRDGRTAGGGGETHFGAAAAEHRERRRERRMAVADLHFHVSCTVVYKPRINQAHAPGGEAARGQRSAPAHGDVAGGRADRADVHRLAGGDAEAAALPDREAMDSRMLAEHAAGAVDYAAGADPAAIGHRFDCPRIVVVGNETDLLALGLVGVAEAERAGAGANFRFGHIPERKERARQSRPGPA